MKVILLVALVASLSLSAFAQPPTASGGGNITPAQKAALKKRLLSRLSEKQKASLTKLTSDLQGIKSGSEVTPEQKQAVKESLGALTEGATKPDSDAVKNLTESVTAVAKSGSEVTQEQKKAVTESVAAVLTSANVSQEEAVKALATTKSTLDASGLNKADADRILTDLKGIISEIQKNRSARKPTPGNLRRR